MTSPEDRHPEGEARDFLSINVCDRGACSNPLLPWLDSQGLTCPDGYQAVKWRNDVRLPRGSLLIAINRLWLRHGKRRAQGDRAETCLPTAIKGGPSLLWLNEMRLPIASVRSVTR